MCTACDVNAADSMNLTALDYCIFKGDSKLADLMVKNGARMDPVLLLRTKCKRSVYSILGQQGSSCLQTARQHSIFRVFPLFQVLTVSLYALAHTCLKHALRAES